MPVHMPPQPPPPAIIRPLHLPDTTVYDSPLAWSERFLRNPKDGTPFDANFLQRQILVTPHRRNVIRVHRRAGKTYSMIILCLYWSMILDKGEILFIAPRMSQVEKFWDDLELFIEAHPFLKESMSLTGNTRKPFKKSFTNGTVLRGFTTGGGTDSVRGQGADVIFLDEVAYMQDSDFKAITPIINGDKRRRFKPIVYAASTPAGAFGKFFKMCRQEKRKWHEIFLSIDQNPEYSDKDRKEIEDTCSSREWETEYLCNFLDAGMNVFPLSLVEEAMIGQPYRTSDKPRPKPEVAGGKPVRRVWRTMGVDWDKFNEDGSGPNIAVVEVDERPSIGKGIPTVIYRESIKQGPQCLTQAVERVIQLNEIMDPDFIFADSGNGENQIEVLHKYGMMHPASKLDKKVLRVKFGGTIKVYDPATREPIKKNYKPFMVNILSKWLEDHMLIFAQSDQIFKEQLVNYRITNQTLNTTTYSKENEHIIDAVGMACVGMFQIHTSPFKLHIAKTAVLMPGPERLASGDLTPEERKFYERKAPELAKVLSAQTDNTHNRVVKLGPDFAVELEETPASTTQAKTSTEVFANSLRRTLSGRFSPNTRHHSRRATF